MKKIWSFTKEDNFGPFFYKLNLSFLISPSREKCSQYNMDVGILEFMYLPPFTSRDISNLKPIRLGCIWMKDLVREKEMEIEK